MSNISHQLTADHYLVTHNVGPNQSGIRLDSFLKGRYRRRSREQIKKAIDSGAITVKRDQGPHLSVGRLKPSSHLVAGDEVQVLSEKKVEPEVDFNYRILHEDQALFVIEKPANLPVHPSGRYFFNTLLTHLKTQGGKKALKYEEMYFLVHRIDKETSGVLVLSKDKESCAKLTQQFAQRTTEKTYLAIVHGITPEQFEVSLPMARSKTSLIGLKMETMPIEQGGLTAHTAFKRLDTAGNFSLLECAPKTGRQHQIRVHLESVGHPIVGDKLYGMAETEAVRFYERKRLTPEAEARLILPRHALHSAGIKFCHPLTGKRVEYTCGLPTDLKAFFEAQRDPKTAVSQAVINLRGDYINSGNVKFTLPSSAIENALQKTVLELEQEELFEEELDLEIIED